ncbi:MAG: winged helix-turn-helix domain-containing protein [Thermoproteota archaeon]|nr:winged helix-turn-helix domain-containing protein [Thermoproteota archaeon]
MNNNPLQNSDTEADFPQNAASLAPVGARGRVCNQMGLNNPLPEHMDPRFGRLLWYLVGSTRGGLNRLKILELISSNPSNANQIASQLKLDYKTVVHHLEVLTSNGLVITDNRELYGATYFLTPLMERNYQLCEEIIENSKNKSI